MAKLWFRFGAMNSGKSTALLQVAYNYEERGQKVIVGKPLVDTKSSYVLSRLGAKRKVDIHIHPDADLYQMIEERLKSEHIDCLLVDEAQFLTEDNVNDLFRIAVELNIPVLAYGIRNDFRTHAFTGSRRLLEIAHSLEELKTICRCGRKAILNGRKVDGEFIREGDVVAIDGQNVEYESLCGKCYIEKVGPVK